ncbi:MAG: UDP-N-acetylmuramate--L-alanine ligase [Candidatus Kapabacteria bacterium]|nr:UDP-N-acetylmuramate--L-alanine ligase [Candidatus Kapabacteria bacterium]
MTFSSIRNVHFVGIGGIGMSGLAEILLVQGFSVSGSDMQRSDTTDYLSEKGALVHIGHDAAHVASADVVVYSSAVRPDANPETMEAQRRHVPLIRRAEMLAEVSRLKYTLAIAGTHGKTTTTSMVGLVLMKGGLDPTVIVGGKLKGFGGTNARLGDGDWVVLEADEYDRSFLSLLPTIAIITNVEADHLDIYTDLDDIKGAFTEFANKVPFYGVTAVCLDDPGVRTILPALKKKVSTYGLSKQCDTRAVDVHIAERVTTFELHHHGTALGTITLNVPGDHNIRNALAAISVGLQLGIPFATIAAALAEFGGVYRRFEIKGTTPTDVLVVDDYAHHPTEIRTTLAAARRGWQRRIVAVFQPHTYSRTRDFADDFALSFDDADVLVLTDVYPAREEPIAGVDGAMLADKTRATGHRHVHYVQDKAALPEALAELLQPGDLLITMGAGDVWKAGVAVLDA